MDAGLLAMERSKLRLGFRLMGQTTPYHGYLGPRTLGKQRSRLGLDSWSLAINAA